jgi:hypothetical protein
LQLNRTMKRIAASAALISLLVSGGGIAEAQAAQPTKTTIELDGYPLAFPVEPAVVNGLNMVPFRAIAEALQVEVAWNAKTKTITATKAGESKPHTVVLRLGDSTATVNGAPVKLHAAPISHNGHTLVPLAFFSSQFGALVAWDGPARTVRIQSPAADLYTMGYYAISSFDERAYVPSFDAVAFGWSRIDAEGRLTLNGTTFKWPLNAGEVTPESIIRDTQAEGTAAHLMVFGTDGKGELTKLLGDPALRREAVERIVSTAVDKQFSGISLDLEGLGLTGDYEQVQQSFTAFVRQLAEEAEPAGLTLSIALHPLNGAYHGYDYEALAGLADELIIMAYPYENEEAPEPMDRIDEAIRMALKEAPREKLVLGISFGSEDASSVNGKIGLAKRYGLKGVAFWRIGLIGEEAMAAMARTIRMD